MASRAIIFVFLATLTCNLPALRGQTFLSSQAVITKGAMADTLHLNMDMVQKRFTSNNLNIIASRFNIEIAKAQLIQARTYYNPNLALDGTLETREMENSLNIRELSVTLTVNFHNCFPSQGNTSILLN